ncbi:MAG: ATP synthase F0 subunit C [Candidatus Schekmanbacteria bacterium RBG_13_48_7]|uniref:ATP synthase subunit c n=1 Tax=Candidatus Schekmanbacteria bacterium RBG_13_48_7 TaxID=1817878 RepID=A0A1F7S3M7_9BACT|nr:MAG: ATP synthase F0 subunit C [Candidatus Schekmanbacteria bacterium RBG_13_48_7]
MDYFIAVVVAAAVAMMVASSVAAIAQSRAIFKAVEGIARQPSASGKITTTMVIGLALIESLAIYVLVIALILFFANPFTEFVVG